MKQPLRIAIIAAAALAFCAPAASAQTRQYEGTVVSVDRDSRTFRIHDSERGTIRVRVTARTRFERISGFAGLRAGLRNIETVVTRSDGRWVALEVERSGGGGSHGGSNDDSDDDDRGRGRGSDDDSGNDRGRGRGRGSDDR
ncbi:hypothetical protein DVA67_006945 [Solirubrobacter sp. CPCC 204708]|uniref:DUF5666 domain-containing protein n=1 Tax=Solirubrobacter deserti TaxID=2282478 RepID=A0ABT4RQ36_9ACTN|nr:hypothetical protein [Solirubrobacter deserti]MBE2315705.1 hypothetical protein [Solirubrobacter deserti]MDA0140406.1 hypothetical protein [Solirubrobacter deserti]